MVDKKITKPVPKKTPERAVVKASAGSPLARKTAARLAAVQVLYQMDLNMQDAPAALKDFIDNRIGFNLDGDVLVPADPEMLRNIVGGVSARWVDVDGIVTAALAAGGKKGVEPLLTCILRAGCWELLDNTKIETGIIINDYMNVTNGFYDGAEVKLVNAVLDKIAKTVRG